MIQVILILLVEEEGLMPVGQSTQQSLGFSGGDGGGAYQDARAEIYSLVGASGANSSTNDTGSSQLYEFGCTGDSGAAIALSSNTLE